MAAACLAQSDTCGMSASAKRGPRGTVHLPAIVATRDEIGSFSWNSDGSINRERVFLTELEQSAAHLVVLELVVLVEMSDNFLQVRRDLRIRKRSELGGEGDAKKQAGNKPINSINSTRANTDSRNAPARLQAQALTLLRGFGTSGWTTGWVPQAATSRGPTHMNTVVQTA